MFKIRKKLWFLNVNYNKTFLWFFRTEKDGDKAREKEKEKEKKKGEFRLKKHRLVFF